jgi:hypothetical protein
LNELKKPCEYCGQDLPLGVDKPTRQVRSYHFSHCTARPEPEPEREWVGLTGEEIRLDAHNADPGDWNDDRYQKFWHEGFKEGAQGAESMLKEKNFE